MTLTIVVMTLVIVWAVRNIAQDLGLKDVIQTKSSNNKEKKED